MANLAMIAKASGKNSSLVSSIENNFWYCFTKAFFGSVSILISASWFNSFKDETTGILPTNSGIKPYFIRSSGSTLSKISPRSLLSSFSRTSAIKPIPDLLVLYWMTLSNPEKAPPHMNSIFEVSTWINSCCGCFLPPCGGTEALVPSMSFSKACWTPSPETSLVIEGLSVFLEILSISSI